MLFVHYQEKVGATLLTDTLMSLDYFMTHFYDEHQTEHFLNSVGKWSEDWGTTNDGKQLDVRVKYIVNQENLTSYSKKHNLEIDDSEIRFARSMSHG